ncbi:hypothetical protein [Acinetobacter sp. ANC 4805]|uniref:hypothetical protein n=1 Tax=Acinetobacter sp. ANC 4805 TaxID=2923425 RepID=UPI001F4BB752|nr:hypothetical protein [Acinetobacter sp. ANC 4805]MCH7312383.1 hypothetical protein [Acinetobacter sp. ANC 4805]
MRTKSEQLFEEILERKKISFIRIEEKINKTPDYKIVLDNMDTYWEIKELNNTDFQRETIKKIEANEVLSIDINSNGLENQIRKAKRQFKGYEVDTHSCVIVIADYRNFFFKDFSIISTLKSLMIGRAHYAISSNDSLVQISRDLGLFTYRGEYISAVAFILQEQKELMFLHNPNARISLLKSPLTSLFSNHEYVNRTEQGDYWSKFEVSDLN